MIRLTLLVCLSAITVFHQTHAQETRCIRPDAPTIAHTRCCTGTNGYFNNVVVNDTLHAQEILVTDIFVSGTAYADVTVTVTDISLIGDLTITGSLIVDGDGIAADDWNVTGDLLVAGNGCVMGDWCIDGDLTVDGESSFADDVIINGDLCISGSLCANTIAVEELHITTSASIDIPLAVSCSATADLIFTPTGDALFVTNDVLIGSDALFDGSVTVSGDMSVTTSICVSPSLLTAAAIVAAGARLTDGYADFYTNLNRYAVSRSQRNIWDVLADPVTIAGAVPSAQLGFSTAISGFGNALALGTVGTANAVVLFDRIYTTTSAYWQQTQSISGSGSFGTAIALSGDATILVVGAPTLSANNGAVTIYRYDQPTNLWVLQQTLTGLVAGERFGSSVSVSVTGEYIAVGAPLNGSGNTGSVYIYHLDTTLCPTTTTWSLQEHVSPTIGQSGAQFGAAISLSSDGYFLAVGAPTFNNGLINQGVGYIFGTDGTGTWTELQGPISAATPASNGLFGTSVALANNGLYAAFGEPGSGRATVYAQRHDRVWDEQGIITPTGLVGTSGYSVSISDDGTILAIGEPTGNGGTGRVTVAVRFNSTWSIAYTLTPNGLSNGDTFGAALTLSRDGSFLIAGAPHHTADLGAGYAFQPGCDLIPGDITITGSTIMQGDLQVNGNLYVTGNIQYGGTVTNTAVTPCTICRSLKREDSAAQAYRYLMSSVHEIAERTQNIKIAAAQAALGTEVTIVPAA